MISHTRSIEDIPGNLAGQVNTSRLCKARRYNNDVELPDLLISLLCQRVWNNESAPAFIGNCHSRCRFSVSRPQIIWLQAFHSPPSDQHTAITGSKSEPSFMRKHNRSPLHPPMNYI
ncbi:uncharacterized protein TNCV_1545111 [Trichonephila clavipes]|nr:uncharacterized protein TNCV_1545111 [Trichonephila clavipes]